MKQFLLARKLHPTPFRSKQHLQHETFGAHLPCNGSCTEITNAAVLSESPRHKQYRHSARNSKRQPRQSQKRSTKNTIKIYIAHHSKLTFDVLFIATGSGKSQHVCTLGKYNVACTPVSPHIITCNVGGRRTRLRAPRHARILRPGTLSCGRAARRRVPVRSD